MARTALLLTVAVVATACARRPPDVTPDVSIRLAAAERAVDEGCYLCLQEALASYETVLARAPDHPEAATRAYLVALMLVARSRQMGVDDAGARGAAERLAPGTPPGLHPLGDLVHLLSWAEPAWGHTSVLRVRDEVPPAWAAWEAAGAPKNDPLAAALEIAVQCDHSRYTGADLEALARPRTTGEPVILTWQRATCNGNDVDALARLLDHQPRFAEARYLIGLDTLLKGRTDEAADEIGGALEAIPDWPRAATTLGTIEIARENFDVAIGLFDRALVLVPDYRQAMLGKLQALSYADRHDEAVHVADRMIALGTWYMGDARYWRAWNLAHLERYDEASTEVAEARKVIANAAVFKLSGIIALRRGEHAFARAELLEALRLDPADCEIPANLGLVEMAESRWSDAGDRLSAAANCYVGREAQLRREETANPDEHERVRRRRARDIAEAHRQQGWSFYQAAAAYASAGRRAQARTCAEAAADYHEWAAQANALLERLKGPAGSVTPIPPPHGVVQPGGEQEDEASWREQPAVAAPVHEAAEKEHETDGAVEETGSCVRAARLLVGGLVALDDAVQRAHLGFAAVSAGETVADVARAVGT